MQTLRVTPTAEQPPARAAPPLGTPIIIATDVARRTWKHAVHWNDHVQRTLSTPGTLEHLQALVMRQPRHCRTTPACHPWPSGLMPVTRSPRCC